jgi:predicted acylesterase/phospholipase RssA
MTDAAGPRYRAEHFATPTRECDLIMKGGVTSGLVYPYAILELAQDYRFRSIGGASAGAIAAAFAAAAEYAREGGDKDAFVRLEARCLQIPAILEGLFQPSAPLKPLMDSVKGLSSKGWMRWPRTAAPFWLPILIGAGLGAAAMAGVGWIVTGGIRPAGAAIPGLVLAALLGGVIAVGLRITALVLRTLPKHGFGLCSGMAPGVSAPVLTDWIHRSLQFIAFGREDAEQPLTFGHLRAREIELKMVTTNLSMRRPHTLPGIGGNFLFDPDKWTRLFPDDVCAYLRGPSPHAMREVAPFDKANPKYRKAPRDEDWPVTVAVRMSLSFPVLIETVPMAAQDLALVADRQQLSDGPAVGAPLKQVLFSDGGLSSNFPIHFFDALLPTRPTFALSLDQLADDENPPSRVSMPQTAKEGSLNVVLPIDGLAGFAGAILGAAKDWQDQMLSVMPGQRERIAHVRLKSSEGGLNLAMSEDVSKDLMRYGREAGVLIKTTFNFDEHRWRRTLVAYEQLQKTMDPLGRIWPAYAAWFKTYAPTASSYGRARKYAPEFEKRIGEVAAAAPAFSPPIVGEQIYPKPAGRLRIVPDV